MAAAYTHHLFSPYRICPVGAHVDHQHGLVTGFALDKGVDLWFDVTEDGSVDLRSESFEGEVRFNLAEPSLVRQGNWGDYARGAKYALRKRFELHRGIRGVLKGSLPVGGPLFECGGVDCLCNGLCPGERHFADEDGGGQDRFGG